MTRDDIESGVGVAGTVGVTTQERRQRSTQEGCIIVVVPVPGYRLLGSQGYCTKMVTLLVRLKMINSRKARERICVSLCSWPPMHQCTSSAPRIVLRFRICALEPH
jgi:hypothetical protein